MKRAQSTEGTGHVLIGLIAILLILYVLFVPPDVREELLADDFEEGRVPGSMAGNVLFSATPGRLEFFPPEGFDHFVPSVHLFEAKNAEVLEEIQPFVVKNGWLRTQNAKFEFAVDDLENTDDFLLAFDLVEGQGDLKVTLNEQVVFEGPVQSGPIALPKRHVQKDNAIAVSVNSVGFQFWKVNRYSFTNVRVIADVTDISRQKAQNVFTISPTEKRNLLGAQLQFVPTCVPGEVGVLTVKLNGKDVSRAIPNCNAITRFEIDGNDLIEEVNTLFFGTTKGDYRIDNIKVHTTLKEVRTFIEFFDVPPRLFDQILRGRRAFLEVEFVDDDDLKRAQVNVNNQFFVINQDEPFFFREVSRFIQPGARNFVEILPEAPLNIVEVRVVVD